MDNRLKILHILGGISIIVTLIMAVTSNWITNVNYSLSSLAPVVESIHYLAMVIAIAVYLLITAKIGNIIQQRLLRQFGFGIIYIVLGTFLLLADFGIADGVSSQQKPGIFGYGLVFSIFVIALYLIGRGTALICKTYIIIAKETGSIYFNLSWKLLALAVLLFFTFIAFWLVTDAMPKLLQPYLGLFYVASELSYTIGQILFSIGAVKLTYKD